MVEKLVDNIYPSKIVGENMESSSDVTSIGFEAKVRYLASSLIVTIPIRVVRDLELKLGDKVTVTIRKRPPTISSLHENAD